jgi:hypothetical protein
VSYAVDMVTLSNRDGRREELYHASVRTARMQLVAPNWRSVYPGFIPDALGRISASAADTFFQPRPRRDIPR